MLDAAKIRTTKNVLRLVGMPALVLGVSMLVGAGINHLARPAIGHWSQQAKTNHGEGSQANNELAGRLMAAELMVVEPVSQAPSTQQNTGRRSNFVSARATGIQPSNAAAVPVAPLLKTTITAPAVTTSLEASITQAVMSHAERQMPSKMPSQTAAPAQVAAPVAATPVITAHHAIPAGHRLFNGRLIRPARTLTMVTTAYSPDERSCGPNADGTTASGKSVWTNGMKMVAADTRLLPFGTLVSVPGYYGGQPVPVLDRGGAIKGNRLDMLYPTHEIAVTWGRKTQKVTVWEYVD